MSDVNKVIVTGRLTRDPELKFLPSNTPLCNFSIAINRHYTKDEKKVEEATFIDCELFGKSAETFSQYMAKGKKVLLEGELRQQHWERNGQKMSKIALNVNHFQFLDSAKKEEINAN